MSHYKYIVLFVNVFDEDKNIDNLNAWLLLEHPGTKPQLSETKIGGVWTASVNMLDTEQFVDKFRSMHWSEPERAILMLKDEMEETWNRYDYKENK